MISCGFSWALRQTSSRSVIVVPILAIVALSVMPQLAQAQFIDAQAPIDAQPLQEKSSPQPLNNQLGVGRTEVLNTEVLNTEVLNTEVLNTEVLNTEVLNTEVLNTKLPNGELAQFVPQPEPSDPNAPAPIAELGVGRYR